jgi:hypothetical protein
MQAYAIIFYDFLYDIYDFAVSLAAVSLCWYTFQYTTGRIVTVNGKVKIVPKQITTPIGIQRLVAAMIIGSTPSAVVALVRKTGRIRRRPAWKAASR